MTAPLPTLGERRGGVLLLVLAVVLACAAAAPAAAADRVVAIGDVHGGLAELLSILEETGLADEHGRWTGGTATLVQVGDLLDRGADVRLVAELMMGLQEQAREAGGDTMVLLGNHEAMNLLGIHRDVNPEAYTGFADGDSDKRRRRAFRSFKDYLRRRARDAGQPAPVIDSATEERFMAIFPRGRLEYMEAMGPTGAIGEWLRGLPVAAIVGDTLFVHGGVSPALSTISVEALNEKVRGEIEVADRVRDILEREGAVPRGLASYSDILVVTEAVVEAVDSGQEVGWKAWEIGLMRQFADSPEWYLLNPEGPLWFRGVTGWEPTRYEPTLSETLAFHHVKQMVVGHTPDAEGRISDRFGGKAFCIDTGMLSSFYTGGQPSALEIEGDTVTAVYLGGREVLTGGEPATSDAEPEPGPDGLAPADAGGRTDTLDTAEATEESLPGPDPE